MRGIQLAYIYGDTSTGRKITATHFERWIELWEESIDERFKGRCADLAKVRAVAMGNTFHTKIMNVRNGIIS